MPDIINSSFDPRLPFPLDVRQQVQDMNALYAIPNTSRWEGMVVYVKGAQIPYILKGGIDNSFWVPFQFNGGGGILPNGIVVYGEAQQSGNNILLNDAWVWRIDQVDYQSSDDTIAITPAASGNLRVDIIVGNNLGEFVLVEGDEVASPGPAIEPNIPTDTVPLLRVDVNDTGITAFEEFALSAFVRFDIANQGLIPTQRQNARTNIQALSKDTNDSRTGTLTQNGNTTINGSFTSTAANLLLNTGRLQNDDNHVVKKVVNETGNILHQMWNRGGMLFRAFSGNNGFWRFFNDSTLIAEIKGLGNIFHGRSQASNESARRDELYLTYPVTIGGTGKLNDVALADGVGQIKFGADVTEVSGIDANGDTKELLIWSDNPDGITLPAEDVLSIAANRFHREVNIPYQTWVKIVYDGDLARWVNGNTGELQETDARYFEVTDDVLTLKYILPDIAALQAFVRGPAVIAEVSDPLRGGKFNYVTEAEFPGTADNGISFLAQDGGYWVRDFEGVIYPQWYGAKGDGINDDYSAIQASINALALLSSTDQPVLFFPSGTYNISQPLILDKLVKQIRGEGITKSVIKATATMSKMLYYDVADAVSRFQLRDIYLDGGTFADYGFYHLSINHSKFTNIRISQTREAGIVLGFGWCNDILFSEFSFNIKDGIQLLSTDNNNVNILNCRIFRNDGIGIYITAGHKIVIKHNNIETCEILGIYCLNVVTSLTIDENYFEANSEIGYTFTTPALNVKANVLINGRTIINELSGAFSPTGISISNNFCSFNVGDVFAFLTGADYAEISNNTLINLPTGGGDLIGLYLDSLYFKNSTSETTANNNTGYRNLFKVFGRRGDGIYPRIPGWRIDTLPNKVNYISDNLFEMVQVVAGNATSYLLRNSQRKEGFETLEIGTTTDSTTSHYYGWEVDITDKPDMVGQLMNISFWAKSLNAGATVGVAAVNQKEAAGTTFTTSSLGGLTNEWVRVDRTIEAPTTGILKVGIAKIGSSGSILVSMPCLSLFGAPLKEIFLRPIRPNWSTDTTPTTGYWESGDQIFQTTLGQPIWYDGTDWVDATGTPV